jgi:peptidoglycan hydrolase-like protein with peptidoglycan-binding domain
MINLLRGFIFVALSFFILPLVTNAAWDINDVVYSGVSTSTAPATTPTGMFLKDDGTKVYISNFGNATIYQFTLNTPYDFSTMSYDNKSKSVSSQGTPDDVFLSDDGTKMFMLSFYDYSARQYTLSTPWDISTATYDSVLLSLGSANHYDFHFKRDGTKFYSKNDYNNRIQQYTLSTPWDLSTAVVGTNYSYGNLSDGQELMFTMSDDGENMYLGTATNERIHWYTLSTPWDTSTATYTGSYKSLLSQDSSFRKVVFNPAGTKMYGAGMGTQKIYVYDVGGDEINPTISSLSPSDNASDVATNSNLIITFDESVDVETGNVVIYKTSDDSVFETIDVTSGQVTGTGTDTITVNPNTDFDDETQYYVMVDSTAFDDTAGNSFAGITASSTWNFTTADETIPSVTSFSPLDDSDDISIDSNLTIEFTEEIVSGSGDIIIYKSSDDSVFETIDVTGEQVTGTTTDTITISPSSNFDYSTQYYVMVDSTAFDDTAGNSFAGITASSTWNFTTATQIISVDSEEDEDRPRKKGSVVDIKSYLANIAARKQSSEIVSVVNNSVDSSLNFNSKITDRDLFVGSEGEDVKKLQNFLIIRNIGPRAQELARVGSTGYFGEYTRSAVEEYQRGQQIYPTSGYFGPLTRNHVETKEFTGL